MKNYCLLILVLMSSFFNERTRCAEKNSLFDHSMNLSTLGKDSVYTIKREKDVVYDDCKTIDSVLVINKDTLKINITKMPSGEIVKYDKVKWADNLIQVKVSTNSRPVINTVIKRKLFSKYTKLIYNKSILLLQGIDSIDAKGVTFSVSVCVPDTDDCYFFKYTAFFDGKTKIVEEELSEDEF